MPESAAWPDGRRITVTDLQAATDRGERWSMLTSYDTLTAGVFEQAGVRALLVGDTSAEMVLGHETTVPVTMDQLIPMVQAVVRGTRTALVVADLPFGSYEAGPEVALRNAVRHLKEGGAQAVKLEGGYRVLPQVRAMTAAGIPVMGHLGLTPQSVNTLGGVRRVQGRGAAAISCSPTPARSRTRARSPWCSSRSPPTSGGGSRRRCGSRPSASAPARTATRRSWSGRIWPG
jgi:3-methyl-2-oxobutanoate hydroxymethyltransferase